MRELNNINVKKTFDLMIKNGNEYFGIAGIMGGITSEILPDTTGVFLESATFNAGVIRRGAVKLGLRTEASARYEKSLDPNMTDLAIKRLAYLLKKENPKMKIVSNLTDIYPKKLEEGHIVLDKRTLNVYMGRDMEESVVVSILEALGFKVQVKDDAYNVVVPTFRATKDIKIKEDLIEEIARIYGLERLEPKALKLDLISNELEDVFNQEIDAKELLAKRFDMHEVHSYIWYDSALLKKLGIEKDNVRLLGKDANNILRDNLSLSLLNIVEENFKNYSNFKIFEIGTIIKNNQNVRVLSIINAGEEKNLESMYNEIKGVVKYLFKVLKNKNVKYTDNVNEASYFDKNLGKIINVDNKRLGEINVISKSVTSKLAKKKMIVCADILFDSYVEIEKEEKLAKEVSKYPTVSLDYTISLNDIKYQDLKDILEEFRSNLIKEYRLMGVYENKYTIRYILGSDTKTLEQKDIETFKNRFMEHLDKHNLGILV